MGWSIHLPGQSYTPGSIYLDSTGYVEYRAGSLPIILSAPHGGLLEPRSLPNRNCSGCVTVNDAWTKSIAEGLYEALYDRTGCAPHLIINLLHRKKFDANRDIGEAANANRIVESAWYSYHSFIEYAKTTITQNYGQGLFLDVHGHAHTIQRIELGYLLSKDQLRLRDNELNGVINSEESSIRHLTTSNRLGLLFADLIRGEYSLGTVLESKGYASVPSDLDPFPQSEEAYFTGGYNTQRHGSKRSGTIDAIQIELNQDIRFDEAARNQLIDSMAAAIIEFVGKHYPTPLNECRAITSTLRTEQIVPVLLFPNPAQSFLQIRTAMDYTGVEVFDFLGRKVLFIDSSADQIDISTFRSGYYTLRISRRDNSFVMKRFNKY